MILLQRKHLLSILIWCTLMLAAKPNGAFKAPTTPGFDFKHDFLDKYYPKANAVCYRIFYSMKVGEIASALAELTEVLGERPWFYFADNPQDFKLAVYTVYIADQCDLIDAFLRKMRVDPKSLSIIEYQENGFARLDAAVQRKMKPLRDELKNRYKNIIADFYAVYFDYLVDLFNIEILSQNAYGAERRYETLEKVLNILRDTERENYYQEALITCKELKELLSQHSEQTLAM